MKSNDFGHLFQSCDGVFLTSKSVDSFKHNYQTELKALLSTSNPLKTAATSCPACNHVMEVKNMEIIELDCCSNCGGIWFDPHELKQIINQHVTQPVGLGETFFKFIPWSFGGGGRSC